MEFVIHRGALVTLIQSLFLITFFVAPHNLSWYGPPICHAAHFDHPYLFTCRLAFHVNVTKLYANTFCEFLVIISQLLTDRRNVASCNVSILIPPADLALKCCQH
jgi:hypothetical protein